MALDGDAIAGTRDPDGQLVVLLGRIWNVKLSVARPELAAYRDDVMATVSTPGHCAVDPRDGRIRFYRRHVGPPRWLVVIVRKRQKTPCGLGPDPWMPGAALDAQEHWW